MYYITDDNSEDIFGETENSAEAVLLARGILTKHNNCNINVLHIEYQGKRILQLKLLNSGEIEELGE